MQKQVAFGPRQWLHMLAFATITALAFGLVFTHQTEVLTFLSEAGTGHRVASTACLFAFVPIFAYCYGGFTRQLLKLLKFE